MLTRHQLDEAMCSPLASVCKQQTLTSVTIASVLLITLGLGFQFGPLVPGRFPTGVWHDNLQMPTADDRKLVVRHSEQSHVATSHGHLCKSLLESTQAGGRWCREFQGTDWLAPMWQPFSCSLYTEHDQIPWKELVQQPLRLVMLGDSMMSRTIPEVVRQLEAVLQEQGVCKLISTGARCGEASSILGLELPSSNRTITAGHILPGPNEGPTLYGAENPGCRDCSGCDAVFYKCAELRIDFIAVEWARDVELQTSRFNTTQEVVTKEHFVKDPPDLIIFNTGAHDLHLVPQREWVPYKTNLKWYAELLLSRNCHLFFVTSTHIQDALVPSPYNLHTTNQNIQHANCIAMTIMAELWIPYLDAYQMSSGDYPISVHTDGIHFDTVYYQQLSRVILQQLLLTLL